MNLIQVIQQLNIQPGTAALVGAGLCVLCLVLPLLTTGVHFITTIVSAVTHLITSAVHVISGGPVAWCGCLVAIGACGVIAMVVWFLANAPSSCAVHATNFCNLLGFSH